MHPWEKPYVNPREGKNKDFNMLGKEGNF